MGREFNSADGECSDEALACDVKTRNYREGAAVCEQAREARCAPVDLPRAATLKTLAGATPNHLHGAPRREVLSREGTRDWGRKEVVLGKTFLL